MLGHQSISCRKKLSSDFQFGDLDLFCVFILFFFASGDFKAGRSFSFGNFSSFKDFKAVSQTVRHYVVIQSVLSVTINYFRLSLSSEPDPIMGRQNQILKKTILRGIEYLLGRSGLESVNLVSKYESRYRVSKFGSSIQDSETRFQDLDSSTPFQYYPGPDSLGSG